MTEEIRSATVRSNQPIIVAICTSCLCGYRSITVGSINPPACTRCHAAVRELSEPVPWQKFQCMHLEALYDLRIKPWKKGHAAIAAGVVL